jgi:hypothetical protein
MSARHTAPPVPGRWPLRLSAMTLIGSGLFALALAGTGRFLPHDERFLGMTAGDLCARHGCRVVHFMIHDRASFGGAMVAIGLMYLWLTDGPLRLGQRWAWWTLASSGAVGFATFFSYLGYGYLDRWHGLATLGLFPCFAIGLARSYRGLRREAIPTRPMSGAARVCLMMTSIGLVGGGLTILAIGMTSVFVPQDVAYLGTDVTELSDLNPQLVPLIAHDRAGFGGAVCCFGLIIFGCVRHATLTRGLWWTLAAAGAVGFGAAIGVHPAIGYTDPVHLAPAVVGAAMYFLGLGLPFRLTTRPRRLYPECGRGTVWAFDHVFGESHRATQPGQRVAARDRGPLAAGVVRARPVAPGAGRRAI